MIEQIQMGKLSWYHILNPSNDDFEFLLNKFHFHPLDIEDCKTRTQRPKIDEYDEYYFMILHFPYFDKINRFIKVKEAKIFWGSDFFITIGNSHWVIKELFTEAKISIQKNGTEAMAITSDALLYRILESLMNETLVILQKIDNEIDLLSRDMFNRKAEKIIERISITRKNIILLNTTFKPQLRVFHKFESGEIKGFVKNMEEYWGNILDYYQKIWDNIEDQGEMIEGLSKTFDSMQANRTNEIMKVLTFISTTLLPLSVITGLYGMNVSLPLGGHPDAFYFVLASMAFILLAMYWYFKRRKWF